MKFERWFLPVLLLMGWIESPPAADGLGRLLTSPEERRLIQASLGNRVEETEAPLVYFEGVMEVEGGRLALWVNGNRIDDPRKLERWGMVLVTRHATPLHLAVLGDDGMLYRLLPGQVFDRTGKRILEAWEVEEALPAPVSTEERRLAGDGRPTSPRLRDAAENKRRLRPGGMRGAAAERYSQ